MNRLMKHRLFKNTMLFVLVSFSLQSCFVAKDYQRPELQDTENLYRTDHLPTDSLSLADVSWKDLFTDALLNKYIGEGLQNNLDIRIALQQMAAAEAYAKQGKAGYLPTLSANASAMHQKSSKNGQFGTGSSIELYELSGSLSWEADIWGKIRSNKRAAEAGFLQTVAAHQAVKTELVSQIANTYYQLLALDAQLDITRKTIANRESSVETIKALKDAGQVNEVAVDQNIAQYNSAKALEIDLETAIFKTENVLSILLGKPAQNFERSKLDDQSMTTDIVLGVPATLLQNRPDVMAAEYGLIQSFENSNIAKSNLYPALTLTASGGLQSLELDNLFNANSLFANIIGGLTQPIFNQRKLKTQREVALAQQEQALLNFKKSLLIAGTEVSNALYAYNAETSKFEFRQNEVEALRSAESNSEELLKNGYANYLDLLTARESALSAELNVINSKLEQLLTVIDIYTALGGGWK